MSVKKVVKAFESRETFVLVYVVANPQINSAGFYGPLGKCVVVSNYSTLCLQNVKHWNFKASQWN